MPSVGVALGDGELFAFALVDGEVQRLNTFAALGRFGIEDVGTARCIRCAVPSIGVALGYVVILSLTVVDGEVEGLGAWAAL